MPNEQEWDALKQWLNKLNDVDESTKQKMLNEVHQPALDRETLRKQYCAELEKKLSNTRLICEEGFSDGYGQLRSQYTKTDEISLYGDGRFMQKQISISGFGNTGSGMRETVKKGRWTTWCEVNRQLELQYCSLSLIDEHEQFDNRVIKPGNGIVVFGDKTYEWSRL